ncbi:MAG: hypothetical protein OXG15_12265 [Gammaproteobacteria bacterium]|nr:hypothetical protein [Gammaproteobacteria bacterium]
MPIPLAVIGPQLHIRWILTSIEGAITLDTTSMTINDVFLVARRTIREPLPD